MTSVSTAAPAHRRPNGRVVASALMALVVLIGCGVVGVATSFGTADGQRHEVVTADGAGRLSPDAVHSGWRTQPGSSARRVGHRIPESRVAQCHVAGPRHHRVVCVATPAADPVTRSGSTPTRGPPLSIL